MSKESWGEPRSRTATWYDPVETAAQGARLSVLDDLQAVVDGTLPPPPISGLVGMGATRVGETGRVTRRGRRVGFADGEVRDDQGRLVATASSTCLVFAS